MITRLASRVPLPKHLRRRYLVISRRQQDPSLYSDEALVSHGSGADKQPASRDDSSEGGHDVAQGRVRPDSWLWSMTSKPAAIVGGSPPNDS